MIKTKRTYDAIDDNDGYRILIDRLWPRGLSKESAHIDLWLKDIAPSTDLRKWYNHEVDKWSEFTERYKKELSEKEDLLNQILKLEKEHKTITLLFSAKDTEHANANVLIKVLKDMEDS